jgi:hypothetical protein
MYAVTSLAERRQDRAFEILTAYFSDYIESLTLESPERNDFIESLAEWAETA